MSFRTIKSITGAVALSVVIAGLAAAAPAAPAGAGASARRLPARRALYVVRSLSRRR
jgi:hypothetical protein